MGILAAVKGIFSDGGVSAIERIATEWIETDTEKAEAQAVMIKAMDPNGQMRRELSRRVADLYAIYLLSVLVMLAVEFVFNLFGVDVSAVALTTDKLTGLFTPISTLFGLIVSASFGVNYANVKQG